MRSLVIHLLFIKAPVRDRKMKTWMNALSGSLAPPSENMAAAGNTSKKKYSSFITKNLTADSSAEMTGPSFLSQPLAYGSSGTMSRSTGIFLSQ